MEYLERRAEMQMPYIAITILALAIILATIVLRSRKLTQQKAQQKTSNLGLAGMLFVVLSIAVGEPRWLGYSLIGLGVLLSLVDLYRISKKPKP